MAACFINLLVVVIHTYYLTLTLFYPAALFLFLNRTLTQDKARGASQAMLYATGLTEQDMHKPQVGIASVWFEGNPCNMHLLDLSHTVKQSVEKTTKLVGYRFNTVGVSDAISMGTSGMRYSLQSREVIADSIETLMSAQWYDGLITLPGCDKNMVSCAVVDAGDSLFVRRNESTSSKQLVRASPLTPLLLNFAARVRHGHGQA